MKIIFEAVIGKEKARDSYKPGRGAEGVHEPGSWYYDLCFFVRSGYSKGKFSNMKLEENLFLNAVT